MNGKKKKEQKLSERISEFCKILESAPKEYAWNMEMVSELDRLTQDYLHKLELEGLRYEERAKVATQLARCRQERRKHKDTAQILEALSEFVCSDKGKAAFNLLRETLGRTRKIEERMNNRVYHPRVLGQDNP